ncbi:MAG: endonuclease/exonuclease/phosphatase family protein [Actinomycetota bacterium]|nr:endonuclease/exonuclease/phosphatase family protein [Actinomycetota bacterium]
MNPTTKPIRFMSFNIRFDTILDSPGNRWADRVASVVETVRRCDPDVVGFQEALRPQLADLTAAFPGYQGIGKPRDVGETAEYVPLFFRARRFDLDESGDFWLSPTPDTEGSRGWDTDVPRHCTWAKIRDTRSGSRFAVFNTHLDRWGRVARVEASRVIVTRVALAPDLPSVVLGDLNAEEASEPLATLRNAGFLDTFREIHPDAVDVQTVHHYGETSGTRKLDYILCDVRWRVLSADIIRAPAEGRLPSDHYPVVADLAPSGLTG